MNKLKVIGAIATVLGLLAEVVSDYVDEKEVEELVDEKIKAFIEQSNQKNGEE